MTLVLLTALLVGCAPLSRTDATTATVTASDGAFSIAVRGVEVQLPAGATDEGTDVRLEAIDAPIPPDVSTFATATGVGIALTLEGKQPQQPLTATFDVPPDIDPESVFVIGEDATTGSGVAFVDTTFNAARSTISATLTHLSWFTPVVVEEQSFSVQLRDWINEALGTSSTAPECLEEESDLQFSPVSDNVVWPCATVAGSGAEWKLHSNSGLVWQVRTEPVAQYRSLTTLSISGGATAAVYNQIQGALEGDSVMLSMETLEGSFTDPPPYKIALKVEPGLSQVATIMWGLSMILPQRWMDLASEGECLIGVVQSAVSSVSGETLRSVLECVESVLTGSAGDILGILLTGPGLLATQLQGIAREIMQTNAVQFTLSHRNQDGVDHIPEEAAWLYDLPNNLKSADQLHSDLPVLIGDERVRFPNSTQLMTRCYPANTVQSFEISKDWTSMNFAIALTELVPAGASVTIGIGMVNRTDSATRVPDAAISWTLKPGDSLPRQQLDITDVQIVRVYVESSEPIPCGNDIFAAEVAQMIDAYVH